MVVCSVTVAIVCSLCNAGIEEVEVGEKKRAIGSSRILVGVEVGVVRSSRRSSISSSSSSSSS